jgi:hypothetical protein
MDFLWRALDRVEYLVTLTRLRLVDAIYGPMPETLADEKREREHERLSGCRRHFRVSISTRMRLDPTEICC